MPFATTKTLKQRIDDTSFKIARMKEQRKKLGTKIEKAEAKLARLQKKAEPVPEPAEAEATTTSA